MSKKTKFHNFSLVKKYAGEIDSTMGKSLTTNAIVKIFSSILPQGKRPHQRTFLLLINAEVGFAGYIEIELIDFDSGKLRSREIFLTALIADCYACYIVEISQNGIDPNVPWSSQKKFDLFNILRKVGYPINVFFWDWILLEPDGNNFISIIENLNLDLGNVYLPTEN